MPPADTPFFAGGTKIPAELLRLLNDPAQLSWGNTYHKYWLSKAERIKNEKFNKYSGEILDLKERKSAAVTKFAGLIKDVLVPRAGVVFCAVPWHDPTKIESGLTDLIAQVCAATGCVNGAELLRRHAMVSKLAHGGDRSEQVHLDSIAVVDPRIISGRDVVLLDDVMTSGNSLSARSKLLMAAGARRVKRFALAKTDPS